MKEWNCYIIIKKGILERKKNTLQHFLLPFVLNALKVQLNLTEKKRKTCSLMFLDFERKTKVFITSTCPPLSPGCLDRLTPSHW